MEAHIATTPFGRRTITLAHVATQLSSKGRQLDKAVHKWEMFRTICTAKELIGVSERALSVLNALLTFHPETVLTGDGLVVFPSNAQLSLRAHGMAPSTLRRSLAMLVDTGLVIRRDSPNGKRYARKGRGGDIEMAFGFDLSPLVARADEFKQLAEEVLAEDRAFRLARERISVCRRDIGKIIATGIEEAVPVQNAGRGVADWQDIHTLFRSIIVRIPRTPSRHELEAIAEELALLADEVLNILESHIETQNSSANESQNGRHIQNSKPDYIFESEYGLGQKQEAGGNAAETENVQSLPKRELPLGIVLDACPDVTELAQGGIIRHWRDLLAAAELARSMLGISPSAWREARETMGEQHAAITLAAIYQRAGQINSAGGYLRSLTDRAKDGKFSTWPMIMALLRTKLDEQKNSASAGKPPMSEEVGDDNRFHVSASLLKSLQKPRSW